MLRGMIGRSSLFVFLESDSGRQTKVQRVICRNARRPHQHSSSSACPIKSRYVLLTLASSGMDRRIEILIAKIESDTSAAWNVASLAAHVNLSPSRLRHLFKEETGTTPANYLKDLRLRSAEELLSTTFLSVKEIVRRVGLGSESHFVREFKRIRGTSPTKYRRATMTQRQRLTSNKRA